MAHNRSVGEQYVRENLHGVVCPPMESTYFSWIDFAALGKGDKLKELLVDECKVGFTDGGEFSDDCHSFMRVNLACPKSILEEAFDRIKKHM